MSNKKAPRWAMRILGWDALETTDGYVSMTETDFRRLSAAGNALQKQNATLQSTHDGNIAEIAQLKKQLDEKQAENEALKAENEQLLKVPASKAPVAAPAPTNNAPRSVEQTVREKMKSFNLKK